MSETVIETLTNLPDGEVIYRCPVTARLDIGCARLCDADDLKQLATDHTALQAEVADLREFVKSLNSFAWEEWHGHYSVLDGNLSFNIKDGEGNSVASGKDALEAIENFRKENQ